MGTILLLAALIAVGVGAYFLFAALAHGIKKFEDATAPRTPRPSPTGRYVVASKPNQASLIIGAIGLVLAVLGTFLPALESDTFLKIQDNTLIQSGDGVGFVIGSAIAATFGLVGLASGKRDLRWSLVVAGLLAIGVAIYAGTGSRLELESAGPFASGATDTGTPGIGIYVCGFGGLLLVVAGFTANRS